MATWRGRAAGSLAAALLLISFVRTTRSHAQENDRNGLSYSPVGWHSAALRGLRNCHCTELQRGSCGRQSYPRVFISIAPIFPPARQTRQSLCVVPGQWRAVFRRRALERRCPMVDVAPPLRSTPPCLGGSHFAPPFRAGR